MQPARAPGEPHHALLDCAKDLSSLSTMPRQFFALLRRKKTSSVDVADIVKSYDDSVAFNKCAQDIVACTSGFLDENPWFMSILDDVARIHPFVSGKAAFFRGVRGYCCTHHPLVVVIAFKACYNMEVTRRQNDKRVIALLQEMKDMMEVLIRSVRKHIYALEPSGERLISLDILTGL